MISTDPKILKRSAALLRDGCANYDTAADYLDAAASEITELRSQLTSTLAERDEAREQRDYFKSCANTNTQEAAGIMRQIGQALGLEVNAPWSEIVACSIKCVAERDRLTAQLDTAWQQSAEATREAAATRVDALAKLLEQLAALSHIAVQDNAYQRGQSEAEDVAADIRALPVPEHKEG